MSLPSPFSFSERVGQLLLAETSAISACAIIGLLSYITYSTVSIIRGSPRRWRMGGPAEVYFLNQLAWDLVQAVGGLMNIKWAINASVKLGPFCSAQGAIKQASDVGSALSTLIISFYTLKTLCFAKVAQHPGEEERKRKTNLRHSLLIVASLWAAISLLVAVNMVVHGVYSFYTPTGLWCWIGPKYAIQRSATDFAFMWTTAVSNIVIYVILFLYFRGYITTSRWRIYMSRKQNPVNVLGTPKQAYGLLFYPLIYTLTILPLSIVRYSTFAHHHIPLAATFIVDTVYLSSGLLNVVLFASTRPFLLPHDPPKPDMTSEIVHDISAIGASHCEASVDGVSIQAPGVPLYESPTSYHWPQPRSISEKCSRGSEVPLQEMGGTNQSSESLGR